MTMKHDDDCGAIVASWQQRAEAAEKALAEAAEDTADFAWLVQSGAHIAYSKDGDKCWLHWAYGKDDEVVKAVNQDGTFDTPRAAIRAARGQKDTCS